MTQSCVCIQERELYHVTILDSCHAKRPTSTLNFADHFQNPPPSMSGIMKSGVKQYHLII